MVETQEEGLQSSPTITYVEGGPKDSEGRNLADELAAELDKPDEDEDGETHRHRNQLDVFNPETDGDKKILIIGAGGIGSTTAYYLAQMGFHNITVVDYDNVENHNIASQFYKESDKGRLKVEALRDNIMDFTGVEISIVNKKLEDGEALKTNSREFDIVISAVDNMATRKLIVDNCSPKIGILEGRMNPFQFHIFFIKEFDKVLYYANGDWFPDSESDHQKCTEKSISYNTGAIGAWMAKYCRDIVRGVKVPYFTDNAFDYIDMSK